MKKKKITQEEHEQHLMERSLKEMQESNIPEPSRFFKVDELVQYGNWDYCRILEVCEGGKYYFCYQETKRIEYGRYEGQAREKRYHMWVTLQPYQTPIEISTIQQVTENKDIVFQYQQRMIESLLRTYYKPMGGLDLNPDYQRGNVWSVEQKLALIDSVFKNVDIGKFTVIRRPFSYDGELYEMLDGKQRFIALQEFYEGRFTYKGKTYQNLHPRDKNHFLNYAVSYAETEPLTPERKYRYFLKLNTTGTPVDKKHIKRIEKMLLEEKMRKRTNG